MKENNPRDRNKIFAVYKPKGPTSFDMVRRVREIMGASRPSSAKAMERLFSAIESSPLAARYRRRRIKVGHAGTLDPLAEGILVIAVGDATKKISEVVAKEKEYEATVRLGMTSTTDDAEGVLCYSIAPPRLAHEPNFSEVSRVVDKFIGNINQVPPIYSAVKVKGKEAYKYARKAQSITLKAREVLVKDIQIFRYEWPFLELKITTGPGVYIRALARDIGEALGVGGYLAALKRTRVGDFGIKNAVPLENLASILLPLPRGGREGSG